MVRVRVARALTTLPIDANPKTQSTGKSSAPCFSIADEEILHLSAQQFCQMVALYEIPEEPVADKPITVFGGVYVRANSMVRATDSQCSNEDEEENVS